jgi:hypothetical protein
MKRKIVAGKELVKDPTDALKKLVPWKIACALMES